MSAADPVGDGQTLAGTDLAKHIDRP